MVSLVGDRKFQKLRLGMVGGGADSFIGSVHRTAAIMDGGMEFIAGALSSTPERSRESGRNIGLRDERNYGSWEEMLAGELALPEDKRVELVSVVTPNHLHFPVALEFVKAGFDVVCDKPMVHTSEQAAALVDAVEEAGTLFCVTYQYTGYPMVRQARHMVRSGAVGEVRRVVVEYEQGWLSKGIEGEDKQASWRTDPEKSGVAGAMGDIGSHAENLLSGISGLGISEICSDLTSFVPGRRLDDDGNVLLRLENGARGILTASQVASGAENDLRIRIFGTEGGIEWHQENPNELNYRPAEAPEQILKRANAYLCDAAQRSGRVPPGHPEAFIEAFANVYVAFGEAIRARRENRTPDPDLSFPTVRDGARGVRFIEKVVESASSAEKWIRL